jgi:hypothetical protein
MKKRDLLIAWFILLSLLTWTSSLVGAVPLSLDQNIKVIQANQAGSTAGGGAKPYSKSNFGKPEFGFVLVQVRVKGITPRWVPLD